VRSSRAGKAQHGLERWRFVAITDRFGREDVPSAAIRAGEANDAVDDLARRGRSGTADVVGAGHYFAEFGREQIDKLGRPLVQTEPARCGDATASTRRQLRWCP